MNFIKEETIENILIYCEHNYSNVIVEIINQMIKASKNGETSITYDICADYSPKNIKMLKGLKCYFNNLDFDCRINSHCTELTIYLY